MLDTIFFTNLLWIEKVVQNDLFAIHVKCLIKFVIKTNQSGYHFPHNNKNQEFKKKISP